LDYVHLRLEFSDTQFPEILEAELSELPFDSFEVEKTALSAFIPSEAYNEVAVNEILASYKPAIINATTSTVPHQNWNSVWESNYEPIAFGDELFVGATFHEIPARFRHSIVLDPNMSFGTGHHPTTAQVLAQLFDLNLNAQSILDFGCGSGILSIYASFKGGSGMGIEIDAHAAEAARKNLALNEVISFEILTGDINTIPKMKFDLILANINRNVIEESLTRFKESLKDTGSLICSGFFTSDIEPLSVKLIEQGFQISSTTDQDNWGMINATPSE
jgi:ribosomal protein L11 methyltransferase